MVENLRLVLYTIDIETHLDIMRTTQMLYLAIPSKTIMLILLPVLTFIATFLVLTGYTGSRKEIPSDWRHSFLLTSVTLGGYIVIYSEILSLFHELALPWIATCWGIALVTALWFGWRQGLLKKGGELLWFCSWVRSFWLSSSWQSNHRPITLTRYCTT
jgi:hypothetical protein